VNVKFEPSSLNETACQLIISSPDSGEYVGILNGYATLPQPKGPFKIAGAKPPPIDFKNPFFEAYEFTVRIDNPSFTSGVKSPVKVDGKKVLSIGLSYKQVPGYSSNGRLTISAG
jgi:hydrocephalus-inducing protein